MEQMGTFMAEYAEWFYMGSSIVILILLIYVLHRICLLYTSDAADEL